jgi:Domain of unknown function (DUF1905)
VKFRATIRYWRPESQRGLAVVNIPSNQIGTLGGLKQMRVRGRINGAEYLSNVMPAGSGRLTLSVSQKMMGAAGVRVGDEAGFELEVVPPRGRRPKNLEARQDADGRDPEDRSNQARGTVSPQFFPGGS